MKGRKMLASLLLCACVAGLAGRAFGAQEMKLESVYAKLSFPDPWLVVTAASLPVYENILQGAGLDLEAIRLRYASEGVVVEGWSEDFSDGYRLMVREDERSQRIYDIERASAAQRKAIANSFTDRREWSLTSIRYQQAEWQQHPTMGRFLFLRYNEMDGDKAVNRGVQYFTIRNGCNYILEWTIGTRRFTNRDLTYFKEVLKGFAFTEQLEAPLLPVRLEPVGGLPTETGNGKVRVTGMAEANATLVLTRILADAEPELLSVGFAGEDGAFVLDCALEVEGTYQLALTASKEGCLDATLSGMLLYQKGLLPLAMDGLPEAIYYEDRCVLTGRTLSGAGIELYDGQSPVRCIADDNGWFTIERDTSATGTHYWTLLATHKGYTDRRLSIEFTRERTQEQDREYRKTTAQALPYTKAANNPEAYAGMLLYCSGAVMEVQEGEGVWFIRLNVSKNKKEEQPVIVLCGTEPEVGIGQRITVYGGIEGPNAEQDEKGEKVYMPSLALEWMEAE